MERQDVLHVRDGFIAVCLSLILHWVTASAMLFIVPLLYVAPRFKRVRHALVPVAVVSLMIVGSTVLQAFDNISDPVVIGTLAIGLFFPIFLLIGTTLWISLKQYHAFWRLVVSSVVTAIAGFSLVGWFQVGSESALGTASVMREVFDSVVPIFLGTGLQMEMDSNTLFNLVVQIVQFAFLPMFLGQFGISALVSEVAVHRKDLAFQGRLEIWHLPLNMIWVFLGSWTLVLFTFVLDQAFLSSVGWNLALSCTLLYLVQGTSILSWITRKRSERVSSSGIFMVVLFFCLIPGINTVPVVALVLLGVSETWIKFRRISQGDA